MTTAALAFFGIFFGGLAGLWLICMAVDEDADRRLDRMRFESEFSPGRALNPPEAQDGESGSGGPGLRSPRPSAPSYSGGQADL